MLWFQGHYLANEADQVKWQASPFSVPRCSGLAPALVLTVGFDPLAGEGNAYVRRLQSAGVEVDARYMPGQMHAWVVMPSAATTISVLAAELNRRMRHATG